MTIQFSELAGDILVPTVAVETSLTMGTQGTPSLNKNLLLAGYKIAAGDATVGQAYRITNLDQAIQKFGIGSQLAVMVEAALRVSGRIPIYAMAYTESAGVAASGTVTLANVPTGVGVLDIYIAGRLFRTSLETGDTVDAIGAAAVANINAADNLPVTAAYATNVITLTARNKGTAGNSLRFRSEVTPGIATTATDSAATFASGTLEGDPSTVLAALGSQQFHVTAMNCSDSTTITTADYFEDWIEDRSKADVGLPGQLVVGFTGTEANGDTLTDAIENVRVQVAWLNGSEQPEFELAAAMAALRCREVHRNLTLDGVVLPGINAPSDESLWTDTADESLAIEDGLTPLRASRDGSVSVVRNVHSHATTSATSPAFPDCEVLEISDYIDADLIYQAKRRFSRKSLKVSSPAGTPNILTPERFKALLHERMLIWDRDLDYTQGAEADIEAGLTIAEQNASDTSRLDVGYPFRPVFGAHVIAVKKDFTTPSF